METVQILADAKKSEFQEIAYLHIKEINHGLLPFLGPKLLSELYKALLEINIIHIWAIKSDNRIIGFLAGTLSFKKNALCLLLKRKSKLVISMMMQLFGNPRSTHMMISLIKNKAMSVFSRKSGNRTHQAELLAIAVDKQSQGSGIGKVLISCFEAFVREARLSEYGVMTNINETGSNAFYRAMGFKEHSSIPHHNLVLRVYIKQLDRLKL